MYKENKPLYRKLGPPDERFCPRSVKLHFRYFRNTKLMRGEKPYAPMTSSKSKFGAVGDYDYTPLYRYLLGRVGKDWTETFRFARQRLPSTEPIWRMVRENGVPEEPYFLCGEHSYWSTLYVDGDGLLQKTDPEFRSEHLPVYCKCCTFSFNGKPIRSPDIWKPTRDSGSK